MGTACCPTTDWLYALIECAHVPVPPQGRIDQSKFPRNPCTRKLKRIAGIMVEARAGSEFNRFGPLPEQRQRICEQF